MSTFRSLRVRNYRLFAAGQIVSLSGTWAHRVAQDWLVLDITNGSALALGITTALQFAPFLLFGLYGGVLADRHDKRRLLISAQAVMGVSALILAALDLTGAVRLGHVWVLAFVLGLAAAVETPVRQAFYIDMVGPDDLPNAVSLNAAIFNTARMLGPAVGGFAIVAVGTGWVFAANAATYAAVLAGLAAIRVAELRPSSPVARARGQLVEALRYVRASPTLLRPIALMAVVGTLGMTFQITLALVTSEVFALGAGAYGTLSAMLALGSVLGALATARRSGPPVERTLFLAALLLGLLELAVGWAPTFLVMALLLVPTGVCVLVFTTTANAIVQLGSAEQVRGRVMSLYLLVFLGGTPIGALVVGGIADVLGPRAGLLLGGLATLLATTVAAATVRRWPAVPSPGVTGPATVPLQTAPSGP